jgi:hypothetical protein
MNDVITTWTRGRKMLSSLDVEVSSLLGYDPMSLGEYIRMFRWITLPSSSVFFFGCLTLKNLSKRREIFNQQHGVTSQKRRSNTAEYLSSRPSGCLRVGT